VVDFFRNQLFKQQTTLVSLSHKREFTAAAAVLIADCSLISTGVSSELPDGWL
jgi:hypothetical protein